MNSSEDFVELDKTNFKCYRFPKNNIYYGEVAYIDNTGKIVTDPAILNDEVLKKELKLVRHGNGVECFAIQDQKCENKYEGSWKLDKKQGFGSAYFADGSRYEGEFNDDVFDGKGKFIWRVGHIYIGNWKQGRMEGEGEFKHQDGHILRGTFKNNYMYDDQKSIFVNPFLAIDY